MVGQMPFAPQRLWNTEQGALVEREQHVGCAPLEERTMDEIVRDGVGVPPHANGDERKDGCGQDGSAVQRGQGDEHDVILPPHQITAGRRLRAERMRDPHRRVSGGAATPRPRRVDRRR